MCSSLCLTIGKAVPKRRSRNRWYVTRTKNRYICDVEVDKAVKRTYPDFLPLPSVTSDTAGLYSQTDFLARPLCAMLLSVSLSVASVVDCFVEVDVTDCQELEKLVAFHV